MEFLESLTPRDGRAVPDDLRANDLAHWGTTFRTADAEQAWKVPIYEDSTRFQQGGIARGKRESSVASVMRGMERHGRLLHSSRLSVDSV